MSMEDNGKLGQLAELVKTFRRLDRKIESKEDKLRDLKSERDRISEELIPEFMQEMGMQEIKLQDGAVLKVEQAYFAKIPPDRREEAFEWLTEQGLDSLIKTEIKANFGKGEKDQARQLELDLQEKDYNFSSNENVHPQTLKALVRERLQAGENMPEDTFGIHVKQITKIK